MSATASLGEGTSRLILTAKGPFAVDRLDVVANEDGAGLSPGRRYFGGVANASSTRRLPSRPRRPARRSRRRRATGSAQPADRSGQALHRRHRSRPWRHRRRRGGRRTARSRRTSRSPSPLELRDKLAADGRYDVFMTREKDEFLRLDDRVRIARQHDADLFISIHADTIRLKGIRGATVYTVSDKASDAEAQALADRENLSDQLAGIEVKEDESRGRRHPDRSDPPRDAHLFDALRALAGRRAVDRRVGLINNPHRFGRLQGAEGAGRAVGAGRARLSLERQGRRAAAQCRMARQGGRCASPMAIALFAAAKTGSRAADSGRCPSDEPALRDRPQSVAYLARIGSRSALASAAFCPHRARHGLANSDRDCSAASRAAAVGATKSPILRLERA